MLTLGIETSCDETGIAAYDSQRGLLGDALHSQSSLHSDYGGVVPELASRDHVRRLIPLLRQLLRDINCTQQDIDGIAYTAGPGLVGALLAGAGFARALAFSLQVPAVAVHHLEAHLLSVFLQSPAPGFPFLTLLVSGGHTLLIQADNPGCYKLLGESVDDAAGEAFDKVSQMLNLGYPGGPAIAAAAMSGDRSGIKFPRPMQGSNDFNFSFSGLKTSVLLRVKKFAAAGVGGAGLNQQTTADVAASFQEAVVDTLVAKTIAALLGSGLQSLVVAGGVAANRRLREVLTRRVIDETGARVYWPIPKFCTDNGAMIAYTGYRRLQAGQRDSSDQLAVYPRWDITSLQPV